MKLFKSYLLTINTEVNLLAVLTMYKLLFHNIIKENEALDMKQFTNYSLINNTEVNLHTALMMYELLIHNISK